MWTQWERGSAESAGSSSSLRTWCGSGGWWRMVVSPLMLKWVLTPCGQSDADGAPSRQNSCRSSCISGTRTAAWFHADCAESYRHRTAPPWWAGCWCQPLYITNITLYICNIAKNTWSVWKKGVFIINTCCTGRADNFENEIKIRCKINK